MTFPAQTFTTGQVLTASQMNEISTEINDLWRASFRSVTSTSDTLAINDASNTIIAYSNTGTTTITIPNSSSVNFTTGSIINILKTGTTGTLSIVQGSGVTIQSGGTTTTNPTITTTGGYARIIKRTGDTFNVEGDLVGVVGGGGSSGALVKISDQTFSGASAVNFDNVFTSTYRNYKIKINLDSVSNTGYYQMRMRASASDNSTSNYYWSNIYNISSASTPTGEAGSGTSFTIGYLESGGSDGGGTIEIFNPQATARTTWTGSVARWSGTVSLQNVNGGNFALTTSFDGFSIYPAAGTITGTIRVYGYAN